MLRFLVAALLAGAVFVGSSCETCEDKCVRETAEGMCKATTGVAGSLGALVAGKAEDPSEAKRAMKECVDRLVQSDGAIAARRVCAASCVEGK
jgi:hypothetical protein